MKLKTAIGLTLMGGIATAFNLTKAIHIDDTAHLEIARWILSHPGHPMSGLLNWDKALEPIARTNQPHLFFYLLAGWIKLASFFPGAASHPEIVVHALVAIFTFGSIFVFHALVRKQTSPRGAIFYTALLFLSPAFLPSQNVMVDGPLLFFWLLGFWFILRPPEKARGLAIGLTAGAALLTKYTSIIFFPLIAYCVRKRRERIIALVVLAAVLVGWSGFNLWDYGSIHILGRGKMEWGKIAPRFFEWLLALGAIAPFSVLVLRRRLPIMIAVVSGAFSLLKTPILGAIFMLNGVALVYFMGETFFNSAKRDSDDRVLGLWFFAAMSFIVIFTPFIAVRHVLLALPPLVLWLAKYCSGQVFNWRHTLTFLLTLFLGVTIGVSDFKFAALYPAQVEAIAQAVGRGARVWYVGHWGWQYYAARAHWQQYESGKSQLASGDYLVQPRLVSGQPISDSDAKQLKVTQEWDVPASLTTRIRSMNLEPFGGLYVSNLRALPWCFSQAPLEHFTLFRVD